MRRLWSVFRITATEVTNLCETRPTGPSVLQMAHVLGVRAKLTGCTSRRQHYWSHKTLSSKKANMCSFLNVTFSFNI